MANLSVAELQKTRTPDRCQIFLDKIFKGEPFVTKVGPLVCTTLFVDKLQINKFKGPSANNDKKQLFNYIKKAKKPLIGIEGKVGNRRVRAMINDLEKTSEFGGKAVTQKYGGKADETMGGNKGLIFEKNLEKDLKQWQLKGETGSYKYKDFLKEFFGYHKKAIEAILPEGAMNKKRPIMKDSKGLYVSQQGKPRMTDVGSTVTDITLKMKGLKDPLYLSLKSTNTVTFFNSGIKKFFTKEDIESGNIKTDTGQELLKLFGLNAREFCAVFNKYTGIKSTEKQKGIDVKLDASMKKDLMEFTKTVIGYGFELVHEDNKGHVHWTTMDEKTMTRAATIESMKIYYGGISGSGKRVDIIAQTPMYELKFNIRSKDGGILPTHMMCDYTSK